MNTSLLLPDHRRNFPETFELHILHQEPAGNSLEPLFVSTWQRNQIPGRTQITNLKIKKQPKLASYPANESFTSGRESLLAAFVVTSPSMRYLRRKIPPYITSLQLYKVGCFTVRN